MHACVSRFILQFSLFLFFFIYFYIILVLLGCLSLLLMLQLLVPGDHILHIQFVGIQKLLLYHGQALFYYCQPCAHIFMQ